MATVIDDENGDLHIQLDCPDHSMLNSGRTKTSAEETEKMGTKRTKKNSEFSGIMKSCLLVFSSGLSSPSLFTQRRCASPRATQSYLRGRPLPGQQPTGFHDFKILCVQHFSKIDLILPLMTGLPPSTSSSSTDRPWRTSRLPSRRDIRPTASTSSTSGGASASWRWAGSARRKRSPSAFYPSGCFETLFVSR